jgi:hypothetical protein
MVRAYPQVYFITRRKTDKSPAGEHVLSSLSHLETLTVQALYYDDMLSGDEGNSNWLVHMLSGANLSSLTTIRVHLTLTVASTQSFHHCSLDPLLQLLATVTSNKSRSLRAFVTTVISGEGERSHHGALMEALNTNLLRWSSRSDRLHLNATGPGGRVV